MKKYLGVIALLALVSCQSNENKTTAKKDTASVQAAPKAAGPVFSDPKVLAIYTNYLQLKDALVGTQMAAAKTAATTLVDELKNYTGCENTSLIAKKIADAKDITVQRKEFTSLSSDVIALFKHADLKAGTIYVQHCPMANNGDGGDWLAAEKKIQNPYYGKEMMECGAVVGEIKAK